MPHITLLPSLAPITVSHCFCGLRLFACSLVNKFDIKQPMNTETLVKNPDKACALDRCCVTTNWIASPWIVYTGYKHNATHASLTEDVIFLNEPNRDLQTRTRKAYTEEGFWKMFFLGHTRV